MKVEFFEQINILPPKERIYSRLGYTRGVTEVSKDQAEAIDNCINQAVELIALKGVGLVLEVLSINDSSVLLENNISLKSSALAKNLLGSSNVLFFAATSGQSIVDVIHEKSSSEDITTASIYDATASEITDLALSWISDYFNQSLRRSNKCVNKRRFSAGYSDFSLDNQKLICDTLDAKKIGVTVGDNYILKPEKTVTAIAGIRILT